MELNLQPRASPMRRLRTRPSRRATASTSVLVPQDGGEVVRYDALEASASDLRPEGFVACRWVQVFKPQAEAREPRARAQTDGGEPLPHPGRPVDRGDAGDGAAGPLPRPHARAEEAAAPEGQDARTGQRELYEHARTKQIYEVPAIDLGPEFFAAVREQLTVLVGEPEAPAGPAGTVPRDPDPSSAAARVAAKGRTGTSRSAR